MGRYILGGKEARLPYEVEELNLRLYTIEELCYYIYNNVALIGDDFIDGRLIGFLRKELGQNEIADKIEKFYVSPSDQDATLLMLLTDAGYYSDAELKEFQSRLVNRKKKNGPERILAKADALLEKRRIFKALFYYWRIANDRKDGRITAELRSRAFESMADAYGRLGAFSRAASALQDAYGENRQERLLRKLYEVTVLSGEDLPERYFGDVPAELIASWEQEFRAKQALGRFRAEESEVLRVFFRDAETAKKELNEYLAREKDKYRAMVE